VPYCPKCHDEFQDWVKVCPDCSVALVEKLPPPPKRKKQDEPLVHIATAPSEPLAKMWAEILEKQGIQCLLKVGDLQASMNPACDMQCDIYVLSSEAKKTKEILAPFLKG